MLSCQISVSISTKAILNKIPLCVALLSIIGSVADRGLFSTVAEAEKSPTTKQSGSTTPASTKGHKSPVTSGTTPKTHAAGQAKTTKSRTKSRKSTKPSKKNQVRGQREIEPSRVLEIQQALRSTGYYQGEPSGKWDASTSQAMSAYQTDNGFKVTGKPDALSLKKLGL